MSTDAAAAPPAIAAHPQRWGVLALYAAASFMAVLVWNILVRAAPAQQPRMCTCSKAPPPAPLTRACAALRTRQAPVYSIAELRFNRGPQAINSLANVRRGRAQGCARETPLRGARR